MRAATKCIRLRPVTTRITRTDSAPPYRLPNLEVRATPRRRTPPLYEALRSEGRRTPAAPDCVGGRARRTGRFERHRGTDRLFLWLLLAQWAFAIILALTVSPYAWEGKARFPASSARAHRRGVRRGDRRVADRADSHAAGLEGAPATSSAWRRCCGLACSST